MTELAHQPETGTGMIGADLARRLVAEALGTGFLVVAVIGSGIMASRLSPNDVGLQLLENAAATAGALIALIWMLGAVSGAHLNPVVTLIDRGFGAITTRDTVAYIAAQAIGGFFGAIVANLMFSLPAIELSTKERSSGALWLSEIVATAGLLLVIHGCVRSGQRQRRRRRRRRLDRRRLLSPPRRASPTPPSLSPAPSRTASPESPRRRHRCSSPCNSPAPPGRSSSSPSCIPPTSPPTQTRTTSASWELSPCMTSTPSPSTSATP